MKEKNVQVQKYVELSSYEATWWQIYTRNLLGMQTYVGMIDTLPEVKKYADVIVKAEKKFKKEIKQINNSKE